MMRQICWVEKLEDGVKREIRVTVGRRDLKWQFKLSNAESWDYVSPPSAADWDELVRRMEDRYQRRCARFSDLELARRLRDAARQ